MREARLCPFLDSVEDSPLMQSSQLRSLLRSGLGTQHAPFLHRAENDIFYAALPAGEGCLFMGPMCSQRLSPGKRRSTYLAMGIDSDSARILPVFTLTEIRNMVLLTNSVLQNGNLNNEELIHLNRIITQNKTGLLTDQTRFILKEEEQNDDAAYRHSYHEERLLMHAVREGRTEDAIRLVDVTAPLRCHKTAHPL